MRIQLCLIHGTEEVFMGVKDDEATIANGILSIKRAQEDGANVIFHYPISSILWMKTIADGDIIEGSGEVK